MSTNVSYRCVRRWATRMLDGGLMTGRISAEMFRLRRRPDITVLDLESVPGKASRRRAGTTSRGVSQVRRWQRIRPAQIPVGGHALADTGRRLRLIKAAAFSAMSRSTSSRSEV